MFAVLSVPISLSGLLSSATADMTAESKPDVEPSVV